MLMTSYPKWTPVQSLPNMDPEDGLGLAEELIEAQILESKEK